MGCVTHCFGVIAVFPLIHAKFPVWLYFVPTKKAPFPKVLTKRSNTGLGLYAGESIKKGTHVINYVGEKISHAEADRRGGKYLFEINSKVTIDGTTRQNTARYINHACRPNCEVRIYGGEIRVWAIKNIPEGEELNYNYGKEYWKEHCQPCQCKTCVAKRQKGK